MKIALVSLLLVFSSLALAQRVDIEIDGRPYSCMPSAGPERPGDAIRCADIAYNGPFTREEALRLCTGARSEAPARCALQAYAGPFTKDESINLCLSARSAGPAECALKAYGGPFTKTESLTLCGSPYATVENANCALSAYAGPYNREEAIRMCKEAKGGLKSSENIGKDEIEALVIQANKKALKANVYKK